MAVRYALASGGLTSGDALTTGTAWQYAHALANIAPGDDLELLGGSYPTNVACTPSANGQPGAEITIRPAEGENVILRYKADLRNKAYVRLMGPLHFQTSGFAVETNNASDHLTFDGIKLDMPPGASTYGAQAQVLIRGNWHKLYNLIGIRWIGMDGIQARGERHHIKGCDFNGYNASHGSLIFYGGYSVIEENYFRNPVAGSREWAIGRVISGNGAYDAREVIFQNNIVYRSNYSGVEVLEGWAAEQGEKGDAQLQKLGGTGTIVRGNLLVENREPPQVANYQYQATFQFDNYTQSGDGLQWLEHIRNIRIYHNTLLRNGSNGFSHTFNSTNPYQGGDVRYLNNVIHDQGVADWYITNAAGFESIYNDYQWHGNLATGTVRDRRIQTAAYATFSDWATAWLARGTGRAGKISNILTGTPVFVDDTTPGPDATRITYDNFRLDPSSPGYGDASPITTVTAVSTGKVIQVADAKMFTDGLGIIQGDQIQIGDEVRRITATSKWTTPQTITVDADITVAINDEVWLTAYGKNGSPGIAQLGLSVDPGEEPPVEEEAPILAGLSYISAAGVNAVTAAFTPPPNSLIFAVLPALNSFNPTPPATINTPTLNTPAIGTISPFVLLDQIVRDAGADAHIAVYFAQVGSSPVSTVVTFPASSQLSGRVPFVLVVPSDYLPSNPIFAKRFLSSASTAPTLDLFSTPEEGDLFIAVAPVRSRATPMALPDGWNELYNAAWGSQWLHIIWKRSGHISAVTWSSTSSAGSVYAGWAVRSGPGGGTYEPPPDSTPYKIRPRWRDRQVNLSISPTKLG